MFSKQNIEKHTYSRPQSYNLILYFFRKLPSEINNKFKKNDEFIKNKEPTFKANLRQWTPNSRTKSGIFIFSKKRNMHRQKPDLHEKFIAKTLF